MMSDRPCTCHPDEAPKPCQKRYAFSECQAARIAQLEAALREIEYLDRPQVRGLPRRVSIQQIARAALEERT